MSHVHLPCELLVQIKQDLYPSDYWALALTCKTYYAMLHPDMAERGSRIEFVRDAGVLGYFDYMRDFGDLRDPRLTHYFISAVLTIETGDHWQRFETWLRAHQSDAKYWALAHFQRMRDNYQRLFQSSIRAAAVLTDLIAEYDDDLLMTFLDSTKMGTALGFNSIQWIVAMLESGAKCCFAVKKDMHAKLWQRGNTKELLDLSYVPLASRLRVVEAYDIRKDSAIVAVADIITTWMTEALINRNEGALSCLFHRGFRLIRVAIRPTLLDIMRSFATTITEPALREHVTAFLAINAPLFATYLSSM